VASQQQRSHLSPHTHRRDFTHTHTHTHTHSLSLLPSCSPRMRVLCRSLSNICVPPLRICTRSTRIMYRVFPPPSLTQKPRLCKESLCRVYFSLSHTPPPCCRRPCRRLPSLFSSFATIWHKSCIASLFSFARLLHLTRPSCVIFHPRHAIWHMQTEALSVHVCKFVVMYVHAWGFAWVFATSLHGSEVLKKKTGVVTFATNCFSLLLTDTTKRFIITKTFI
jgi:hypothetical protein